LRLLKRAAGTTSSFCFSQSLEEKMFSVVEWILINVEKSMNICTRFH